MIFEHKATRKDKVQKSTLPKIPTALTWSLFSIFWRRSKPSTARMTNCSRRKAAPNCRAATTSPRAAPWKFRATECKRIPTETHRLSTLRFKGLSRHLSSCNDSRVASTIKTSSAANFNQTLVSLILLRNRHRKKHWKEILWKTKNSICFLFCSQAESKIRAAILRITFMGPPLISTIWTWVMWINQP